MHKCRSKKNTKEFSQLQSAFAAARRAQLAAQATAAQALQALADQAQLAHERQAEQANQAQIAEFVFAHKFEQVRRENALARRALELSIEHLTGQLQALRALHGIRLPSPD